MSASANLPIVESTKTIGEALERMVDTGVSAIVIKTGSDLELLEYETLWEKWRNTDQLAGLTGRHLNLTTEEEQNFEAKTFAVMKPVAAATAFAVVLVPPTEAATYKAAPKLRTCADAQKHTLPPTRPTPRGTCGACGSQIS